MVYLASHDILKTASCKVKTAFCTPVRSVRSDGPSGGTGQRSERAAAQGAARTESEWLPLGPGPEGGSGGKQKRLAMSRSGKTPIKQGKNAGERQRVKIEILTRTKTLTDIVLKRASPSFASTTRNAVDMTTAPIAGVLPIC